MKIIMNIASVSMNLCLDLTIMKILLNLSSTFCSKLPEHLIRIYQRHRKVN